MPTDADTQAFLQAWSRLEAFAKARGGGIGSLLTDLGVRGGDAQSPTKTPTRIEATGRRLATDAGMQVRDLALPSGLYGAVAVAQAAAVPRVRAFPAERPAIERLLAPRAKSAPRR